MSWLIIAVSIGANAAASMLVKVGMTALPEGGSRLHAAMYNPWLWAGVILYAVAFFTYALALRVFPLNLAHPVLTAGAIGVVAIGSVVLFHETLPVSAILGLVLLIAGVTLLSLRPF